MNSNQDATGLDCQNRHFRLQCVLGKFYPNADQLLLFSIGDSVHWFFENHPSACSSLRQTAYLRRRTGCDLGSISKLNRSLVGELPIEFGNLVPQLTEDRQLQIRRLLLLD